MAKRRRIKTRVPLSATIAVHLKEHEQRRREIEFHLKRLEADRNYGLLASAVVWTWVFTNAESLPKPLLFLATLMPPILTVLLFHRSFAHETSIDANALYIRKIESTLNVYGGLGWESWLAGHRQLGQPMSPLRSSTRHFWTMALLANLGFALVTVLTRWSFDQGAGS